MTETSLILYETPAPRIARIVLNRPGKRNAQDTALLYALNEAFDRAARDDEVTVIVLAANGPHFSAGHDLSETDHLAHLRAHRQVGTWSGFAGIGAEATTAREREIYLGFSERWRNIPKPTIAQVQGKCIAGGLMLIWPCDLIVASEDALFQDNTLLMGIPGVEFFAHPWELGARQAKEWLFTADWLTAADAHRRGMVNRVVPNERLEAEVLSLAQRIAERSPYALKLAKEAINAAQDAQGRVSAMHLAFVSHQLAHSHCVQVHGLPIDPAGISPAVRRP